MPLLDDWIQAGSGIVVSKNNGNRKYRVGEDLDFVIYLEVESSEVRVWVGLTYDCALAKVEENEQPNGLDEIYQWSMDEDSRVIGSYQVTREYRKVSTQQFATPPVQTAPSISLGRASVGFYLDSSATVNVNVTRNSPLPDSKLYCNMAIAQLTGVSYDASRELRIDSWLTQVDLPEATTNQVVTCERTDKYTNDAIYVGTSSGVSRYRSIYRIRAYEHITTSYGYFKSPETIKYVHVDNDALYP